MAHRAVGGRVQRRTDLRPPQSEQHWFIPYPQIAGVDISRKIPARALLHLSDGRQVALAEPWTTQNLTDDSGSALLEVLRSVGGGGRARR